MSFLDFIIKSGRAVMFPVYKGTYERYVQAEEGTNAERDMEIACLKDFSRSSDYLCQRLWVEEEGDFVCLKPTKCMP